MAESLHLDLFERPRFRDGVVVEFNDHGLECSYRDQGCEIEFDSGVEEARSLFQQLQAGGRTLEELGREYPAMVDELPAMVQELDALGLLTETDVGLPAGVISGRQFYRELRRFADRLANQVVTGPYHEAMTNATITAEQLIGYALEYYHLVRMAPRLIAPALAKEETPAVASALMEFFVSELRHDRMIEQSLASVGISRAQLDATEPLPMTFALCASIGAYAAQNPLAFKSVLYLFEQAVPEFNDAFQAAARRVGLPDGFVKPILAHARLNDDGDHGNITAELLAAVAAVGVEEQQGVKKLVAIVIETMALQEEEMMRYYGRPGVAIPRVFR
jgi:pyrroloquinoline quinone (PQQ) biosynthesis protein C